MDQEFADVFGDDYLGDFPYIDARRNEIAKARSLLKGELFFDLLLSDVAGINEARRLYPPGSIDDLRTIHKTIKDAEIEPIKKSSFYYYMLRDWPKEAAAAYLSHTPIPETFYVLIDAFYALDNLKLQDALNQLTNPIITLNYIPKILSTLLNNSDASLGPKLVVTFVETTQCTLENDSIIKLYFKALLQVSIMSAFRFQREVTGDMPQLRTFLLVSLFEYCLRRENGMQALKVINLPLDATEEAILRNHLLGSKSEVAKEMLLMYQMHLGQLCIGDKKAHSTENHLLNKYLQTTRIEEFPSIAGASSIP